MGMRMRLIIKEPERAKRSTRGWRVKPAKRTLPNQRWSRTAPCAAATQRRDAAGDTVGQDDAVIQTLQAAAVGYYRRSDPERDDIGEGVEFPPHPRSRLPPAGNAAVEDIED